jgi:hypothetical protein
MRSLRKALAVVSACLVLLIGTASATTPIDALATRSAPASLPAARNPIAVVSNVVAAAKAVASVAGAVAAIAGAVAAVAALFGAHQAAVHCAPPTALD